MATRLRRLLAVAGPELTVLTAKPALSDFEQLREKNIERNSAMMGHLVTANPVQRSSIEEGSDA
jgi:hypothetical protein